MKNNNNIQSTSNNSGRDRLSSRPFSHISELGDLESLIAVNGNSTSTHITNRFVAALRFILNVSTDGQTFLPKLIGHLCKKQRWPNTNAFWDNFETSWNENESECGTSGQKKISILCDGIIIINDIQDMLTTGGGDKTLKSLPKMESCWDRAKCGLRG